MKFKLKKNLGQASVEYILMLAVMIFIALSILNKWQEFFERYRIFTFSADILMQGSDPNFKYFTVRR